MNTEPALRLDTDEIEDQIIDELLDRALGRGWSVSVFDGEEFPLRRCYDKATIRAAMRSTDTDYLYFHGSAGEAYGWVWLVYGNGEDLITDLTIGREVTALETQVHERFEARP